MKKGYWKRFVGDRAFYKMLLLLLLPMIVQQGITNFVSLLDNLMVGSLGTEQMSGVAIVNQLFFVYNLALFGAVSGVSIFGAQFFGLGDNEGMRHTVRLKLYLGAAITVICIALLLLAGPQFIGLFLNKDTNDAAVCAATLGYAMAYLRVIVWGFFPFMMVQVYAGTLRETGETMVPMIAGVAAVVVNLTGNYLLIFGNGGFPRMGAAGARCRARSSGRCCRPAAMRATTALADATAMTSPTSCAPTSASLRCAACAGVRRWCCTAPRRSTTRRWRCMRASSSTA